MASPSPSRYEAGAEYILPRDKSEQERLETQHEYTTILLFESRLIYDSSVVLTPGDKVLDAGTGTGIWLQDLSEQVSDTIELFGCDVSPNSFPTHHADNIHFCVASVTALPEDWSDKFAFVNQRFLFSGLQAPEWPVAISELYRVLKPGGHVQLAEITFGHFVDPAGAPATRRLMDLCTALFTKAGLFVDVLDRLEDLLKEANFGEVNSVKKYLVIGKARGKMGELGKRIFSRALRNLRSRMLKHGVISAEEELDSLMDTCEAELDNAEEGFRLAARVATARKPPSLEC